MTMKNKKLVEIVSLGIVDEDKKGGDGYVMKGCACCICFPEARGAGDTTAKQGSHKFAIGESSTLEYKNAVINIK
jgi:hypothetical protein